MKIQSAMKCPQCGDGIKVTDVESGEVICSNCGFVMADKEQENRRELNAFSISDNDPDRSMSGSKTSLAKPGMGLSTVIGRPNLATGRLSGAGMDSAMRSTMERLRTWDLRIQRFTDRNLRQAFRELDRLKDVLGLSDIVVEKAAYIYRKAQERGLVRGRTV